MTIIAATDGMSKPDRVVSTAAELAAAYSDQLVVLYVFNEEEFEEHRGEIEELGEADSYSMIQGEQHAARIARRVVDGTLESGEGVDIVGRVGKPVEEILAVADERNARYLVIGGRKRTPVGKAVFGSITQSVLLHADRPVVTVMSEE
jgi:nucleotide-binding universal stress UspA family protein